MLSIGNTRKYIGPEMENHNIPVFDLLEQYRKIESEILSAIKRVLESGRVLFGPETEKFEKDFAEYICKGGFGVAVGSGTDALAIALRALDIGPGDEVITVSNTAIPTVSAIRMAGATPRFVDVDPRTCLMDVSRIEEVITVKTKAIIPVHLFGNSVDMVELGRIAEEKGLKVVEDCAQAAGTLFNREHVGTFGNIGCFSFYPTKNLGAYGDGGFCYTKDEELAERIKRIRFYGCSKGYYSEEEGVNSRMDEIQAAILNVKLKYLDDYVRSRREIASIYDENLDPIFQRTPETKGARHSYHLFVIKTEKRERIVDALKKENIGFGIHYPTPIHLMKGYGFLGVGKGSLPITERLSETILSLPCFPELAKDSVMKVCKTLNSCL